MRTLASEITAFEIDLSTLVFENHSDDDSEWEDLMEAKARAKAIRREREEIRLMKAAAI